jgi:cell division septal protein FtsQ
LAAAAAVLAALALSGYLVYASVTSKPWRLGGYTVRGTSYLTAQEVLAAAGFEAGDNLFWADLDEAERKLCRHPRIRRAKVARRLPAEVVIAVEERPATAAFVLNGELYKVSSDGVVLGPMAAGYEDLPILVGVRYRAAQDVSGKKLSRGELGDALATLEALSRVDPAWAAAIEYVDVNDRVVALAAGRYVVKYSANFDERTARRLRRVYEATRANGHGGATYDVRFGTDVVVTYRDARAGGAGGGSADDGAV